MENNSFAQLGLSENVLQAIDRMGFEEPSQIQTQAIPVVMQGHDVIGQAQTGTGKTLAFGAPVLSRMEKGTGAIQTLILVPTRELAIQVNDEIARLNQFTHFSALPVYGGQPIERQLKSLRRGVDIVVGTPGRILDHMRRGSVDFGSVSFFVLDEADEMLNMGFIDDIRSVIESLPAQRQTLLFSATMPDPVRRLASRHMRPDVKNITVASSTLTVPLTEQFYFEIKLRDRLESLCRILDADEPESALIFCRTKKSVDELTEALQIRGYSAEGMHGDMNQNQRLNTLRKFREGTIDFLVATDVAARGIDVENISHVINYELPEDVESYVHRIGRTGRANHSGIAFSLVTSREYMMIKQIEKATHSRIRRRELPTIEDIYEAKYKAIRTRVRGELDKNDFEKFAPLASELDEDYNLVDVAAALMKLLFESELTFNYGEETDTPDETAQTRLFVSAGRLDGIRPGDIVRIICDGAGVSKNRVGHIDIFDKFSFVNVPADIAPDVIDACSGQTPGKRVVNFQPAAARKRR